MTEEKGMPSDTDRMRGLEEERLRQRLVSLERHSEKVRSRERLFGVGILIALLLAAVAAFTPHFLSVNGDEVSMRTVSAEVFVLRDVEGVIRGRWAVDDGGNSRMTILDRQGRTRMSLSVLSNGSPGMSFSNSNGTPRAALALLPDESTSLTFADGSGIARTILGLSRADATHLVFADADGVSQISIGLDAAGEANIILPTIAPPEEVGGVDEGGS
jgi:hypothetical protein